MPDQFSWLRELPGTHPSQGPQSHQDKVQSHGPRAPGTFHGRAAEFQIRGPMATAGLGCPSGTQRGSTGLCVLSFLDADSGPLAPPPHLRGAASSRPLLHPEWEHSRKMAISGSMPISPAARDPNSPALGTPVTTLLGWPLQPQHLSSLVPRWTEDNTCALLVSGMATQGSLPSSQGSG